MSVRGERKPVVLVVDDDAATRYVLASTLGPEGFSVIEAEGGQAAIDSFGAAQPDIVLMDVEMPETDGYKACEAIRSDDNGTDVPIVMVTGHDDPQSIDRAFAVGATDFISKPINWSLISHRLRYILRGAAHVKKIHRMAYYDSLTGLPNRALFKEHVDKMLRGARTSGAALTIFNIDLNRFKRINDTLGTSMGDTVLIEMAARLSEHVDDTFGDKVSCKVQPECCLACFGGDEFALALSDTSKSVDIREFAEELRKQLGTTLRLQGHELVVTGSVGIASYPQHGESVETLLKNAESARDEAKRLGRNTQKLYRSSMNSGATECLNLENELRRALENDELSMYYQPKHCTRTLQRRGAEALLRWHHPQRGEIPPAAFIPIAEESGLITDLGVWVANRVCEQISLLNYFGMEPGPIAINVSGQEFGLGDPVETLTQAIRKAGISASALELEITETVLLSDIQSVMSALHALREEGFSVAVDDFGTGYSSLRYLQRFPVDVLKIDSSFVHDVERNADSRAICRAIVALARGLGLAVVGEGVQSEWQLQFLQRESCDMVQGYLLSEPLSAEEFTGLLKRDLSIDLRHANGRVIPIASRI
ncbi:MAG: two-component system response regulator [Woeseiaceae bacterium]